MTPATDSYLLLRALVDELARCGMRAACTSPGSRSTPIVLTLAREKRLRCYSHVDERCAGFFALGLAKASGLPVAVACTSGTAAAELLPAVIEAREARVPLLVLSADRPSELRDNGAGQAIDQLKLFGDAAKWFVEVDLQPAGVDRLRWIRTLACRAYATTLDGRPGVVHLNFPLREPLLNDGPLPEDRTARQDGQPHVRRASSYPSRGSELELLRASLESSSRGVIVAGRYERSTPLAEAASQLALRLSWPLLADPMSGARRGDAAIAHYDAILREPTFTARLKPDLVLRVGDLPVSKPLRSWLAGLGETRQIVLDHECAWQDPASTLTDSLSLEPAAALADLTRTSTLRDESDWLATWRSADELAAAAISGSLEREKLTEPSVAAELGVVLPAEATLFVASSMPVRDIETFWPARRDPPRVLCNRGANGIDGTVSAAFGAAAADEGPVVLLIGDVALAHDIGGLLAAKRLGLKLTIVLLENDGGGIFDFLPLAHSQMARMREATPDPLPQSGSPDIYSTHISTPTGLDFSLAAGLYGLDHRLSRDVRDFRAALEQALAGDRSTLIEVRSEREENVALHRSIWEAVSLALSRQAVAGGPLA
jgi:2-succinyl-5-enolpyruvyl-6-hydroxy-3-cyclohexene-1-carboxylate synthase